MKRLSRHQKQLRRTIIELSYKGRLSHLGSCLSAVDLIDAIYSVKKREEKFILSNGHAAVALYAVLAEQGFIARPGLAEKLPVHPDRNEKLGIYVSTGSLGHGLPIAVGMALANKTKNYYCMISDGECTEGSIWETLRVASELNVTKLKVILNANGWGAYHAIDIGPIIKRIRAFGWQTREIDGHNVVEIERVLRLKENKKPLMVVAATTVEQLPFLKGQDAHYYVMTEDDYNTAIRILK